MSDSALDGSKPIDLRTSRCRDVYPVLDVVTSEASFLVASDGSADTTTAGTASFAWVMATVAGDIVVQCAGPVFGLTPTSYRAEAYGILSPTCFLHRLLQFHGKTNIV